MSEEHPAPAPSPDQQRGPGQPMVSRTVVTIVTLGLVVVMGYSATQQDYRSMVVSALVLLFILGADLTAIVRGWRGGGQS